MKENNITEKIILGDVGSNIKNIICQMKIMIVIKLEYK